MALVEKLDSVLTAAKVMGYAIKGWNETHVPILSDDRSIHVYRGSGRFYYIDEWDKETIIVDNIDKLKEKLIEIL